MTDTVTVTTVPDGTEIVVGGSCIPLYVIVLLNTKSQTAEVVITVVTVTCAHDWLLTGVLTWSETEAQLFKVAPGEQVTVTGKVTVSVSPGDILEPAFDVVHVTVVPRAQLQPGGAV